MVYTVEMPRIEDIMTPRAELITYDENEKEKLAKICSKDTGRDITYLPDIETGTFFKFIENENRFDELEEDEKEERKISKDMLIFSKDVFDRFTGLNGEDRIKTLFVYDNSKLVGMVHFADYNKKPAFVYLYSLLFELENNMRDFLDAAGKNNYDMLSFFKEHSKRYYRNKYCEFTIGESANMISSFAPFQMFNLEDLISLINHCHKHENSEVFPKIDDKEITDLRNRVMHSKYVVETEDYESSNLIFRFDTFETFIKRYRLVIDLIKQLETKISQLEKSP